MAEVDDEIERALEQLGEKRKLSRLVVTLRFASAAPSDRRASVVEAVHEWIPSLARAAWDSEIALRIETEELETLLKSRGRTVTSYAFSNAGVHSCLMDILALVIPKLAAAAPIAAIDVAIVGVVSPFDTIASKWG